MKTLLEILSARFINIFIVSFAVTLILAELVANHMLHLSSVIAAVVVMIVTFLINALLP